MATGLYRIARTDPVMVSYGRRQIPISCAQYKANGYKPARWRKLTVTKLAHPRKVADPSAG